MPLVEPGVGKLTREGGREDLGERSGAVTLHGQAAALLGPGEGERGDDELPPGGRQQPMQSRGVEPVEAGCDDRQGSIGVLLVPAELVRGAVAPHGLPVVVALGAHTPRSASVAAAAPGLRAMNA